MMKLSLLTLILALTSVGCSQKLAKDRAGETRTNDISLVREFQRVIVYDCNRKVISDSIETVASPTKWVEVTPDDPRGITSSSFVNRQTESTAGLISNNTSFQVDYSYGALNMRVVSGLNIVDYKFFIGQTVAEEGTVTLNVSYSERHLAGYTERTHCPQPSPAPAP